MPMSAIRYATELQQAYNVIASRHMDSLFPDKPTAKLLAERQRVYETAVRQLREEQAVTACDHRWARAVFGPDGLYDYHECSRCKAIVDLESQYCGRREAPKS